MRPIPDLTYDFIKGVEGLRLTVYADKGGKLTVGYGHTSPDLQWGQTITEAQAEAFLHSDCSTAATRIALYVAQPRIDALSEHQYAALISFAFNLGFSPAMCPTLIKLLNAGNYAACPTQMMLFDHERINGQLVEVQGLYNRRAAEVTLWKTADVGAAVTVAQAAPMDAPPSSYTRSAETPPIPVPDKPLSRSKSFVAACCTAVGTATVPLVQNAQGALKTVHDTITPYTGDSAILQHLSSNLSIALAGVAVAVPFLLWLKSRKAAS